MKNSDKKCNSLKNLNYSKYSSSIFLIFVFFQLYEVT